MVWSDQEIPLEIDGQSHESIYLSFKTFDNVKSNTVRIAVYFDIQGELVSKTVEVNVDTSQLRESMGTEVVSQLSHPRLDEARLDLDK